MGIMTTNEAMDATAFSSDEQRWAIIEYLKTL